MKTLYEGNQEMKDNNKLPDWWPSDKPWIIGDCLEGMKAIPDKVVDLIMTDPPYGIGVDYGVYEDTRENLHKLIEPFLREALRISKLVILTPGFANFYDYPRPSHVLIWCMSAGTASCSWGFNCYQPILAYGKDPFLANRLGRRPDVIFSNIAATNLTGHPCPKPIDFWTKLLERCSIKSGDVVLDPFLGSGTTLLACRKTGRIGLGFEINPEYEDIIRKRSLAKISSIDCQSWDKEE